MIPVEVKLSTSRGSSAVLVPARGGRALSPLLTYVSLLSVLQETSGPSAPRRSGWTAGLTLSDRREIRVEDLFTAGQPSVQAAALVAAPLAFVMTNEFQRSPWSAST